jgi:uncharacterized paraquat-inducible protein A
MPEATFACPKCKTAFNVEPGTDHIDADCPVCSSSLIAWFFPALFRAAPVGAPAAALVDNTEASCFNHPQKQAVRVCDGCGRLICSLCSIEMGTEHLCPNCISSGKKKGKITTLENNRTRYDSIALSLAIFGFLLSVLSFVMAPAAIYISIRHWNSPGSLLGVSKTRFVIATIIAVLELLFWGAIILVLIFTPPRTHH